VTIILSNLNPFTFFSLEDSQGRSQDFEFRGLKPMASAEPERITGVWGQSPQRGPGAEPLVGVRGAKPPLKLKGF